MRCRIFLVLFFIAYFFISATPSWAATYYISPTGSNSNNGTSTTSPFSTIQHAADIAAAGDTIKILPGEYREAITPANAGTSDTSRITFEAQDPNNPPSILGSVSSKNLTWRSEGNGVWSVNIPDFCATCITYHNWPALVYETGVNIGSLSSYPNTPEMWVARNTSDGILKYPIAREPNITVDSNKPWRFHESWWTAQRDYTSSYMENRAKYFLKDTVNLAKYNNLTYANIFMLDSMEAFYSYRRKITRFNKASGEVGWATTDPPPCVNSGSVPAIENRGASFDSWNGYCDSANPNSGSSGQTGIDLATKYYIEGIPELMDKEMEWYADENPSSTNYKRLFIKTRGGADPTNQNLEIAVRSVGFNLTNKPYINLKNLKIFFINNAYYIEDEGRPTGYYDAVIATKSGGSSPYSSKYLLVDNLKIAHSGKGIYLYQGNISSYLSDHITIKNSEFYDLEGDALTQAADVDNGAAFPWLKFQDNQVHHIGFRPTAWNSHTLRFNGAYKLVVSGNNIHDVAHFAISGRIAAITDEYVLIKDNIIDRASLCYQENAIDMRRMVLDQKPKILIMGNLVKETHGWSYASEQSWNGNNSTPNANHWWYGESGSGISIQAGNNPAGAMSVIPAIYYRNILVNNPWAGTYRGYVYNNTFVNTACNATGPNYNRCKMGIASGFYWDSGANRENNVRLMNNIFYDMYQGIISNPSDASGNPVLNNTYIDYNLYQQSSNIKTHQDTGNIAGHLKNDRSYSQYVYPAVTDIINNTPWEDHGIENSGTAVFNMATFNPNGNTKSNYQLDTNSKAKDKGTTNLIVNPGANPPTTIGQLITDMSNVLGVAINDEPVVGSAPDIGALEYQGNIASPSPSASSTPTPQCKADANADKTVNLGDISLVLGKFGQSCTGCKEDINSDGVINIGDISFILTYWGQGCI